MSSRIQKIEFARARAKVELVHVIGDFEAKTKDDGLVWTLGKLLKDCPSVAVTITDTVKGTRITHPVPLWLPKDLMAHELRAALRAVMREREPKKASSSSGGSRDR